MGLLDGGELRRVPHKPYGAGRKRREKHGRALLERHVGMRSHEIVGREKERYLFAVLASAATG